MKAFLILVIGIGLMVIAIAVQEYRMTPAERALRDAEIQALQMESHFSDLTERLATVQLKTPSTAQFGRPQVKVDGDLYSVFVQVDSQNDFGAMTRKSVFAKYRIVDRAKNTYNVESFNIVSPPLDSLK